MLRTNMIHPTETPPNPLMPQKPKPTETLRAIFGSKVKPTSFRSEGWTDTNDGLVFQSSRFRRPPLSATEVGAGETCDLAMRGKVLAALFRRNRVRSPFDASKQPDRDDLLDRAASWGSTRPCTGASVLGWRGYVMRRARQPPHRMPPPAPPPSSALPETAVELCWRDSVYPRRYPDGGAPHGRTSVCPCKQRRTCDL